MTRVARFPRPGETVRALEWHFGEDAGKGTNVAVALGRLGVKSAFVCKVGADEGGELGAKWLKSAGVDLKHYMMCRQVKTDVGLVITQSDGENMIIGSAQHPCYMSREELFAAIEDYREAEFFLTGLEIDPKLPIEGCRYAKARGMTTLLNASPLVEEIRQPLDCVDYLFVNELEGTQLSGQEKGRHSWYQIAELVRRRYQPQTVVMTLGNKGCVLCNAKGSKFFTSYEAPCVDSIAAGDGFMAAFAAGLTWGMADGEAADWANRYSAVMVSRKGAILSYPTLNEVKEISGSFKKRQASEGA